MRRLVLGIISCMALCAITVVRAVEAVIDWGLRVLPIDLPSFDFTDQLQPLPAFATYADPRVDRHEAGISRRAAARHV